MWETISYVSSGLTLAAFLAAVAAWKYRSLIVRKESLVLSAPEKERPALVERVLESLHVDTAGLTKQQKYELVLPQIRAKAERWRIGASVITLLAFLAAAVAALAIWRNAEQSYSVLP